MSLINSFITEIEQESANSRKILERVPSDKFDWQPHEKSRTLKQLASHIANLSERVGLIVKTDYLDLSNNNLKQPIVNNTEDLVRILNKGTEDSLKALKEAKDGDLDKLWVFRNGEHIIFEMPKAAAIRVTALNHSYHHRGQLGVYLRLLNVPIPGMYGPSADESLL